MPASLWRQKRPVYTVGLEHLFLHGTKLNVNFPLTCMVQRPHLIELSYTMSILVSTANINPVGNGKDILRMGVCKCSFFPPLQSSYALNLESYSCLIVQASTEEAILYLCFLLAKKSALSRPKCSIQFLTMIMLMMTFSRMLFSTTLQQFRNDIGKNNGNQAVCWPNFLPQILHNFQYPCYG